MWGKNNWSSVENLQNIILIMTKSLKFFTLYILSVLHETLGKWSVRSSYHTQDLLHRQDGGLSKTGTNGRAYVHSLLRAEWAKILSLSSMKGTISCFEFYLFTIGRRSIIKKSTKWKKSILWFMKHGESAMLKDQLSHSLYIYRIVRNKMKKKI